jgi:MerR family transcriptional regulator, light-induced transcriptional regulator
MINYSINDIEKLSGVKAHTIRIWEKRYNILPTRKTETNIRYYLEEDLQLILNIAHLNRSGTKISKIACMKSEEIQQKVAGLHDVHSAFESELNGLMLSLLDLNEYRFLKIINHNIRAKGFENTLDEVIYPLLDKLGEMWMAGSVKAVHESFINNIVRRKISIEIDKLTIEYNDDSPKFLIYLPEYENHELSILYAFYILKKYGANTLYLGPQISLIDVKDAVEIFKPHYIFTLFNDGYSEAPLQPYIDELTKIAPEAKVLLTGYKVFQQKINISSQVKRINTLKSIKEFLPNHLPDGRLENGILASSSR